LKIIELEWQGAELFFVKSLLEIDDLMPLMRMERDILKYPEG
jgi:hypothetical protein